MSQAYYMGELISDIENQRDRLSAAAIILLKNVSSFNRTELRVIQDWLIRADCKEFANDHKLNFSDENNRESILDVLRSNYTYLVKFLIWLANRRFVGLDSEQAYECAIRIRYHERLLTLLGLQLVPLTLEEIFLEDIDAKIEAEHKITNDIAYLIKLRSLKSDDYITLSELCLSEANYFVVFMNSGMGKTTFTRYLAQNANTRGERVLIISFGKPDPSLEHLSRFSDGNIDLLFLEDREPMKELHVDDITTYNVVIFDHDKDALSLVTKYEERFPELLINSHDKNISCKVFLNSRLANMPVFGQLKNITDLRVFDLPGWDEECLVELFNRRLRWAHEKRLLNRPDGQSSTFDQDILSELNVIIRDAALLKRLLVAAHGSAQEFLGIVRTLIERHCEDDSDDATKIRSELLAGLA